MKKAVKENNIYQSVIKGAVVNEPYYHEQEIEDYVGNPLIEALPPIFNEQDIYKAFCYYPEISDDEKMLEPRLKNHIIVNRLKRFLQPLSIHFNVEKTLSILLRQGYIARSINPIEFNSRLRAVNELKELTKKEVEFEIIKENLRSTAASCSIIGVSGIGKTTAIERLLKMYPQVIIHKEFKRKPILCTQLVWIKIDCPFDGSLKTLCKIFFKAVDEILGSTDYFTTYGNDRNSVATMMIHMTHLATLYSIGILVIDEIQHLLGNKNSSNDIMKFFTTLTNTIGVPSILIGTPKALDVLKRDFRQARRSSGNGNIEWDRMKQDEEWNLFIETMWEYQWLDKHTPLDNKLKEALYYETQGITSVTVDLFILVQERAIERGETIITEKLIHETAKNDMSLIRDMIKALRTGDINTLSKYEDISLNFDEIIQNIKMSNNLREKVSEISKMKKKLLDDSNLMLKDRVISDIVGINMFPAIKYEKLSSIVENSIKKFGVSEDLSLIMQDVVKSCLSESQQKEDNEIKRNEKRNIANSKVKNKEKNDLRKLYEEAEKKKIHFYDILVKYDYIKNPVSEFLGEVIIC